MKTLTIKDIKTEIFTAKFGEQGKYYIKFEEDPRKKVISFVGAWNMNWGIGTVINVFDGQFERQEFRRGNVQYKLKAPSKANVLEVARKKAGGSTLQQPTLTNTNSF